MADNTQYRVRCQTCGELFVWADAEPTECPNDGGHSLVAGCIAVVAWKGFGHSCTAGAPAVTNDETEGYRTGWQWHDSSGDATYLCTDATEDAAVWVEVTAGGGVVVKAIDHTWEGDGTTDREIDLGDDYDEIRIYYEENGAYNVNHLAMAYAFRTTYGTMKHDGTAQHVMHYSQASSGNYFKGKMTGGDSSKLLLGGSGGAGTTNENGKTFRAIGLKFSSME